MEHNHLDFGQQAWFDLWHTHLDFFGLGNTSLKVRRAHIKAQLTLYENLIDKLQQLNQPYQTWIEINELEAGQDAVYIHTKNPNSDNFPLIINELKWNQSLPHFLEDLIDLNRFHVGQYKEDDSTFYIIQSKGAKGMYNFS